jgi:asparagine synthase (glutamine-hydrolysing)
VTVVLTGEGSDELFGGYPRYRIARLLDQCAGLAPLLLPLVGASARLLPARGRLRVEALVNGGSGLHIERLAAFVGRAAAARALGPARSAGAAGRSDTPVRPPSLLPQALVFDQQTYLQSLLNRMDKMSMAASVEGRVPFLDHRLVELAARVPPRLKIRRLQTKFLLKQVARRHLPPGIIDRRKAGFAVPIDDWLRAGGPLAPFVDMLSEPRSRSRGWLDGAAVAQLAAEHRDGAHNHAELLWGLINLELWQRVLVDRPAAGADANAAGAARGAA